MAYPGITKLGCDHCGEQFSGSYEDTRLAFILHPCPHWDEPDYDNCKRCIEDEKE